MVGIAPPGMPPHLEIYEIRVSRLDDQIPGLCEYQLRCLSIGEFGIRLSVGLVAQKSPADVHAKIFKSPKCMNRVTCWGCAEIAAQLRPQTRSIHPDIAAWSARDKPAGVTDIQVEDPSPSIGACRRRATP
jgi:hypothetical protein